MHRNRYLAALAVVCVLVAPAVGLAAARDPGPALPAPTIGPGPTWTESAARLLAHHAAVQRNVRLAARLARRHGRDLPAPYARRAALRPTPALRRSNRRLAAALARARASGSASLAGVPRGVLDPIAACESGGNPAAIGGGGAYRGLFQMTTAAWSSVGGRGDPAQASPAEQYHRAALLYRSAGAGQWPVCGR